MDGSNDLMLPLLTLLIIGGFWASSPFGLGGPAPTALVVIATVTLAAGAVFFTIFLMAAAGFARSAVVGHPRSRPRSVVPGVLLGSRRSRSLLGWHRRSCWPSLRCWPLRTRTSRSSGSRLSRLRLRATTSSSTGNTVG